MTRVTAPFDRVLERIRLEFNDPQPDMQVVDILATIGREAITRAATSKETRNITLNQMEAFAYGVYFNGECVRQGYLDKAGFRGDHERPDGTWAKGAEKDSKRGRMGRSMALHDIRDHVPTTKRYELFLVNSMWYSAIHEQGWTMRNGAAHRPLRIITQEVIQATNEIAATFGVTVNVEIGMNGQRKS